MCSTAARTSARSIPIISIGVDAECFSYTSQAIQNEPISGWSAIGTAVNQIKT